MTETKTEKTVTCEKHGEYIATTTITIFREGCRPVERTSECPGCEQERIAQCEREAAEEAEQRRRRRIAENRKKANIPERFAVSTFENYIASSADQRLALSDTRAFAENFAAVQEAGNSLTLCGKPGCGKTHLACAVANYLLDAGRTVIYQQAIELVRAIRATWHRESGESETSVIARYRNVDLLILDEIGVSFGSEAEKTQLFDILDGRYREMRPTLIVSNLSPKGLRECLGERVYDRLMQNGSGCVVFNWASYRPSAALTTRRSPREQGGPPADGCQPSKGPPKMRSVVEQMRELREESEREEAARQKKAEVEGVIQ